MFSGRVRSLLEVLEVDTRGAQLQGVNTSPDNMETSRDNVETSDDDMEEEESEM